MSSDRRVLVVLAVLLASYVVLSHLIPPSDDEIYYWCWARQLQLSYFDHPPLTAYMIRASIEVFGDHIWAIRLPACLANIVVLGVLAHLMRPRQLWYMLLLTPLFSLGSIIITPDTPLLLFWSLYLLWLVKAQEQLHATFSEDPENPQPGQISLRMWLLGGLLLGLGGLGKYPMIFAVPAGTVSFLLSRRPWSEWLPGYILHGLLAFILVIPVFVFNWQLDFAPFRFQWEHATCAENRRGLISLFEFLGIQLLLVGWIPLLIYPWAIRNVSQLAADPKLRVCFSLFVIPFSCFLYMAFKKPLEGNWALACYIGVWPLAAHWMASWANSPWRLWLVRSLFTIPLIAVLLLTVHLLNPLPAIKPSRDRITRQQEKMKVLEQATRILKEQDPSLPVYTPLYQWTALLNFYQIPARQLDGVSRPSHFTTPPHVLSEVEVAYVFNEGPLRPEQAPGFGTPVVVANIPLVVRGEVYTVFQILKYTKLPTPGEEQSTE